MTSLLSQPDNARRDKVELVYESLDAENKKAFRELIADEVAYGHQLIATQLQAMGFMVDRKQIHSFREKLKLGRVTLEPNRPTE